MLHIASEASWHHAQRLGRYSLPGGVIHGCSLGQLRMVVAAHFPSLEGFVVLTIDESQALGEVRWVTYTQGGRSEAFPHLHGSCPVSAVSRVEPLARALASSK